MSALILGFDYKVIALDEKEVAAQAQTVKKVT